MAEMKKYLDTAALGTLVDQIKAEDAKVSAAAKAYADSLAPNYDAAGSAATAESNAKAHTDELANGAVKANTEAITKLNGDEKTDGSVAKAVADAKTAVEAEISAVDAKVDQNAADIAAINNAESGVVAQAKAYTDGEITKVNEDVADLTALVGTIPDGATATDIVGYVQEKTAGIATDAALGELQASVNAIDARMAVVEGDYLVEADKTELQGNIDTVSATLAGVKEDVDAFFADAALTGDAKDTLKELQEYIASDETGAASMTASIKQNSDAIDAVEARVGTAEGKITALEGKMTTAEGNITANAAAITALQDADTTMSDRIDALENVIGESSSVAADITAAKNEAIAAAAEDAATKDAAVLADAKKYADDEDAKIEARVATLETASGTHALASDLTALTERVTTAEGEIDTLQADVDAAELLIAGNTAKITENSNAIALKASKEDLDAAVVRVASNEVAIANNTSAINSFTAITSDEIDALFA